MSLKDLDIKLSYISCGDDNIAKAFLVPALKQAKRYRRSVGFFSSGVFGPIIDGIVALSRSGGTIELIASPKLNAEDVEAINLGYQRREQIIENAFTRDFLSEIEALDDAKLQLLATLIANGILDIRIAVTETVGIYHDKLGIIEDFDGNVVVFYGSANESLGGYKNNYEKIRVVKSWVVSDVASIEDEQSEFEALWNGLNPYVKVIGYKESAKTHILEIVEQRKNGTSSGISAPIKLRDYQEEAINAWVNNGYHGFYVMATGTGKTWTAIYSAKKLLESHAAMIVICAPYKHLVRQWADDVEKAFPQAHLIMVSSENPAWEQQISQEIIRKQYSKDNQIIVISTIASFKMPRFMATINKSKDEKLLIVDEAHRFTDRPDVLKTTFKYMLGLSATPYSGRTPQKGLELMTWFGDQVFNLPIEIALERGFLVPYNYYPIYVSASEDEEGKFRYHTQKILYQKSIRTVEEGFRECFTSLINKSDLIDGIHIDGSLNVLPYKNKRFKAADIYKVLGKNGAEYLIAQIGLYAYEVLQDKIIAREEEFELPVEVKQQLSAGEKQIFIMALYHGLSRLNKINVPYIVDTPFARIDKEHRSNILANFFTKLNGQILILSTDEEIVGNYQEMVSDLLSNTFVLNHTPGGNTEILKDTYFGGQAKDDQ